MKGGRTGYFTAKFNGETVYEGYLLDGELLIVKAPRYGMRWYEGLMDEEEYNDHLMGNPFEYASKKYGARYLKHLNDFTKRVLRRIGEDLGLENLLFSFREMPEDHVRTLLGLRTVPTPHSLIEDLKGVIQTERSPKVEMLFREYAPNYDGDFVRMFIYPSHFVVVGRYGGTGFAFFTSSIRDGIRCMERLTTEDSMEEGEKLRLKAFAYVGVPLASVKWDGRDGMLLRVFRRIQMLIKAEGELHVDIASLTEIVESYRRWVKEVKDGLFKSAPPDYTLPAWRKMVLAYLDEYPHPKDFVRKLTVDTGMDFNLPPADIPNGGDPEPVINPSEGSLRAL